MENLGQKIRDKRLALNLNIADLAEKSGLSKSLISQVERGKVVPSVVNVVKLVNALNCTISDFFNEEDSVFSIKKPGDRNIVFVDDSSKKYEFLAPIHGRKIEYILISLNKSWNPDNNLVTHDGEEAGYVLEGSMVVNLNGEKHILNKGDSIYFSSTTPHMYESYNDEECISIWAMTPPSW